jgi:hypothetical protein
VRCWGEYALPPDIAFKTISLSNTPNHWYGCGVRDSGLAHCWGKPLDDLTVFSAEGFHPPPESTVFRAVSAGLTHSCGLRESDEMAECWGKNSFGEVRPVPEAQFSTVRAGNGVSCGIRTSDRRVQCWGSFVMNALNDSGNLATDPGQ